MENKKQIHHWLYDNIDGLREIIRFKDRLEYRQSGKLHNPLGLAIKYIKKELNQDDNYYINGIKLTKDEWFIYHRIAKIDKIKRNIKNTTE